MIDKKTYPVYCSWCKDKVTICGESTVEHSSGICNECFIKFFKNTYVRVNNGIDTD